MDILKKAKKDRIDLEAITKNIEENYKPAAIRLTSYEEEQESNAIISYQELLTSKDSKQINYDDAFQNKVDVNVKKQRQMWIAVGKDADEINKMSDMAIKKLTFKKMIYPLVNAKFLDAIEGMSMEVEMY